MFPTFNKNEKLVGNDGKLTKSGINYLTILQNTLKRTLSQDGHVVPDVDPDIISQIESDPTKNTVSKIIKNKNTGKYMLLNTNTNKFENITTTAV